MIIQGDATAKQSFAAGTAPCAGSIAGWFRISSALLVGR
jgi:hypothetical protein